MALYLEDLIDGISHLIKKKNNKIFHTTYYKSIN